MSDEALNFSITKAPSSSCPYPKTSDQCNVPMLSHQHAASNLGNQTGGIKPIDNGLIEKSRDVGISIPNRGNSNDRVENGISQNIIRPSAPYIDDLSDSREVNALPIGFINIADKSTASQPPPPPYDQVFTPESTNIEIRTSPTPALTNHVHPSSFGVGRNETPNPAYNNITRVTWNGHGYTYTAGNTHNNTLRGLWPVNMTGINNRKEILNKLVGFFGIGLVASVILISLVYFTF